MHHILHRPRFLLLLFALLAALVGRADGISRADTEAYYACFSTMPTIADVELFQEYMAVYNLERERNHRFQASGTSLGHTGYYDPCASLHAKLSRRWRLANEGRDPQQAQEACATLLDDYLKQDVRRPEYLTKLERKFKGNAQAIAAYIFEHSIFTSEKMLKRFLRTPTESKLKNDAGFLLMMSCAEFEDSFPPEMQQTFVHEQAVVAPDLPPAAKPTPSSISRPLEEWMEETAQFDDRYPRERTFLHFDNDAYIEGDTLYYKAFVTRAGGLALRPVSRVLYVELLNIDGNIMERQLVHLDSLGQGSGNFDLGLPVKNGFYEVRAYTREMTNWESACFSRIIPIFKQPKEAGDFSALSIKRPESERDLLPGHVRPFDFGKATPDAECGTLHPSFASPPSIPLRDFLADLSPDEEVGVAVFQDEHPVWFQRITSLDADATLNVPDSLLHSGTYRIEVFDLQGRSRYSGIFEKEFPRAALSSSNQGVSLVVRQSQREYAPFSPIAIEVELKDEDGHPLTNVPLAISVRDADGELTGKGQPRLSEYLTTEDCIAQPFSQMCGAEPFPHPQPIEDSLIVRGYLLKDNERMERLPNTHIGLTMYSAAGASFSGETVTDEAGNFAFKSNADYTGKLRAQFTCRDAESDKLKWTRVVLDQWFGPKPRKIARRELELRPTRPTPAPSLRGRGEITSSIYGSSEKVVSTPLPLGEGPGVGLVGQLLFAWTDTIPDNRHYYLNEAVVKGDKWKRYRGLNFDRYTYGGGEETGMRHMDYYFNVELELERAKDRGLSFSTMQEFLTYLLAGVEVQQALDEDAINFKTLQEREDEKADRQSTDGFNHDVFHDSRSFWEFGDDWQNIFYNGRPLDVIVNNGAGAVGTDASGQGIGGIITHPEELKSVMLSFSYRNGFHGSPSRLEDAAATLYIYTRPDWYLYREKKGISKRILQGFNVPLPFPMPNYREADAPNPSDYRRTIYWNPSLTTDANGRASAVFFSNAREEQRLRITVRGITPDGRIIEYDR